MQTFLYAVNTASDMSQERKDYWREACRQHYLGKLLVWARAHPWDTESESEQKMLTLCEGRSPEQLEQWCVELKLI